MKPLSGKDLCKFLEANGWTLDHITGSHHIYTKPGHPSNVTVPVHGNKTLKKGTFNGILKAAGLRAKKKKK